MRAEVRFSSSVFIDLSFGSLPGSPILPELACLGRRASLSPERVHKPQDTDPDRECDN